MARRRSFNVISMSFLDAMTCGFGAVILFFMIITANIDLRHDEVLDDTSSEVDRMELKVLTGRKNLVRLRDELAKQLEQLGTSRGLKERLMTEITQTEEELDSSVEEDAARRELIQQLRADLAELQAETERLSAESVTPEEAGNAIRSVQGEGYRQYLTGLRMGGDRIVILVDVSTSMLDRTIVNIIRRRNMSLEQQRAAPKWRQVVNTVDWLTAQLRPDTQFQVVAFSDTARSLVPGTDGEWLTVTDGSQLEQAVETLRGMTPDGPTSLHAAFAAVTEMQPRPDNVYLLVDGLPTMGDVLPTRAGVTSRERANHFDRAVRNLPRNIPINVILFAMEGDPQAAPAYWTLALSTGGSMMAPAEDWP